MSGVVVVSIQWERIWTHFRVYFNPLILSRDLHVFFASLSKHHSHRIVVCRSHVACEPEKWNWKDICMSEWVANKSENICVTMCIIGEYAQWMVRFHKYHKTLQSFFPKKRVKWSFFASSLYTSFFYYVIFAHMHQLTIINPNANKILQ